MQAIRQKTPRKYLTLSVMTIILCSLFSWTAFAAGGAKVKKLSVTNSKVEVQEGKTVTISAKVTATKNIAPKQLKVKVKSSNPGIAEVKIVSVPGKKAKSGTSAIEILGKKTGTCKITITTAAKNSKGKKLKKVISVTVSKTKDNDSNPGNNPQSAPTETLNISDMKLTKVSTLTKNDAWGDPAKICVEYELAVGNYEGTCTLTFGSDAHSMTVEKNSKYKISYTWYPDKWTDSSHTSLIGKMYWNSYPVITLPDGNTTFEEHFRVYGFRVYSKPDIADFQYSKK